MENSSEREGYRPTSPARVLRQVDEKGYASCEDLMQLNEGGVPIYARLAQHFGVGVAEAKRRAERQEVSPEDVRAIVEA